LYSRKEIIQIWHGYRRLGWSTVKQTVATGLQGSSVRCKEFCSCCERKVRNAS
jgi:hypothetical protein